MFPIIKFKNIKKQFRKKIILDNINLEINQGDIFGIIGMSGSGKTTLLNILIGFLKLDQGEILYYSQKDKEYKKISENMTEARKIFGFASQAPSFYPKLTVKENLYHFGSLYRLSKKTIKTNTENLLKLIDLEDAKDKLAQELSGGMERRLNIACSLVHKPKILILDEPTADLDPIKRKETWQLIKGVHNIGTTIIVASHLLSELEPLATRIAILHNNNITAVGTTEQIRNMYFKTEELQIRTHPGKYNKIAKSLENLNLNIKSIVLKDKKLVIYTSEAENVLHRLLHIIERKNEKLIDVNVNKPSLAEIFETIEQK